MNESSPNARAPPSDRELDLIEMLRSNPSLMDHVEEIAMMTRDPEDLLKSGHDAEQKMIDLTRAVGRSGLQKWAEAANERCERKTEGSRPKGQRRHGKKNSTG